MKRRYDRKILSDILAELGEKLGRAPRPGDLEKGMPSKSTFMRHFGDWKTALEYAGYVDNVSLDGVDFDLLGLNNEPSVKIVNLLGMKVKIVGPGEESVVLEPEGTAKIIRTMPKTPAFADELAPAIAGIDVKAFKVKAVLKEDNNGVSECLPKYQKDVFYLVTAGVAKEIYRFGRTSNDLLYPIYGAFCYEENCQTVIDVHMVLTRDLEIKEGE